VTQVELAARLRKSQSFVSKVEKGETRLEARLDRGRKRPAH
jgi:transcriptional regulator with XRE-family HTH domain